MITLAEQFVVDRQAMAYEAPYFATDTEALDDGVCEMVLADRSVVHCIPTDPQPWKVGRLPDAYRKVVV